MEGCHQGSGMNNEETMKGYLYTIQVDKIEAPQGDLLMEPPLSFSVRNHDDLFSIVARMKARNAFSEDEATALAIGIKLFGEVMLNHRDNALFTPIREGFSAFMQGLKQGKPAN